MSQNRRFFANQQDHSRVKSEIVSEYIVPYGKIMGSQMESFQYVDLFAGPGLTDDGLFSTPLLIMEQVAKDENLQEKLKMRFNDADSSHIKSLEMHIKRHPAYEKLRYEPQFANIEISPEQTEHLSSWISEGTLTFVDPFGYKEISLDMIDAVTEAWGCDCIFYLSTRGLIRNFPNCEKWPKIKAFLGESAFDTLLKLSTEEEKPYRVTSTEVTKIVKDALREKRDYRTLFFQIDQEQAAAESHHLVLASKSNSAFRKMREIMVRKSLKDAAGMPLMLYSPKIRQLQDIDLTLKLDDATLILHRLADQLYTMHRGQTVQVMRVFENCLDQAIPFLESQIRKALSLLRDQGKVTVRGRVSKRILNSDTLAFCS